MRVLTREWVDKAEGDFHTAMREARALRFPNYDAVCFHAQQCAEKYLKAYLQEHERRFSRTHNLIVLLEQCREVDPSFEFQREWLKILDRYAVSFRYPGEQATREEARDALRAMREVRAFIRQKLGLEVRE